MKILSKEEEKEHYDATVKGGLYAGTAALGIGGAGSYALYRLGWKPYRSLTIPLRAFAVVSLSTFALILGADHASRKFELQRMRSNLSEMREAEEFTKLEESTGIVESQSQQDEERATLLSHLSRRDRTIEWAKDNKYKLVFGAWTASMIGSFGYIATTPLSFSQKLVQARMYAQGLTVAVMVASAGLAGIQTGATGGISDEQRRTMEKDNEMYRWKKGSPHAKLEEQERKKHLAQAEGSQS